MVCDFKRAVLAREDLRLERRLRVLMESYENPLKAVALLAQEECWRDQFEVALLPQKSIVLEFKK